MTHRTYFPAALVGRLLAGSLLGGLVLGGCRPACDIVPTQSLAHLRIIDAVGDVPVLTVRIDSEKIFDKAYYNLDDYGLNKIHPALNYLTNYQDGSGLSAGPHRLTAYGTDPKKALVDTTLVLTEQSETLVYAGLAAGSSSSHLRVIQLYDEWTFDCKTCPSHIRFVQAVPDLPAIDVYFLDSAQGPRVRADTLSPDIRLYYGQITDGHGGGLGTGKVFSDYVVLASAPNTLITKENDTTFSGTIVRVPYPLSTLGLFNTILIRGRSAPVDTQASISLVVMRDGPQFGGSTSYDYRLYGVRLANATRIDSLSLLIHQPGAIKPELSPRNNVPGQPVVFDIKSNVISDYWRLTTLFDWNPMITIARTSQHEGTDGIDSLQFTTKSDARYTLIAIDTIPLGSSRSGFSRILLDDTLDIPATSNLGRVRFVNASPDHASITVTGSSGLIASIGAERSVVTKDIAIGSQTLAVSDGTNTGTISVSVNNDTPITVIFTAATATNKFPYAVAIK